MLPGAGVRALTLEEEEEDAEPVSLNLSRGVCLIFPEVDLGVSLTTKPSFARRGIEDTFRSGDSNDELISPIANWLPRFPATRVVIPLTLVALPDPSDLDLS